MYVVHIWFMHQSVKQKEKKKGEITASDTVGAARVIA